MYDRSSQTQLEFFWDANGNLAQMIGCKQNSGRLHEWDEENRLRFVLGDKIYTTLPLQESDDLIEISALAK